MIIRRVTLAQFRQFNYREFSFTPNLNYLIGPNGSGKTTVLEAIGYLSRGRSFRTHRDNECVQQGQSSFSLQGTLTRNEDEQTIGLAYEQDSAGRRKVAKIDGETLSRLSNLQGLFPTTIFTPETTELITGSPGVRREWLNRLGARFHEDYLDHLKQYEQARKQRNQLLKQDTPDQTLMDQYNRTMIKTGRSIIRTRNELISSLQPFFVEALERIGHPWKSVQLNYQPSTKADHFASSLEENRNRDRQRGYTTIGPHRDNWEVLCEGKSAARYTSRGEQRLLVISLKFSESDAMVSLRDSPSVLLLDDLESELDGPTYNACLEHCKASEFQVLLTGTSARSASIEGDGNVLQLESNGKPNA